MKMNRILAFVLHASEKPKPQTKAALVFVVILSALPLSGCLTRQTGPSLPYVKPATSVNQPDAIPLHLAARMQDMEAEMQRLRDLLERLQASGAAEKDVKGLQERVAFIEKQLGIESSAAGGKPNMGRNPGPGSPGQMRSDSPNAERPAAATGAQTQPSSVEILSAPLQPEEKAYRDAYGAFKSGAIEQSLTLFEDFLNRYPKSEFAANAVYWMGEARFSQGHFDEAVLQFDRVIKEFPGSKKELSSMLRQGQAFEKMGDNRSAKIIFQKILTDYPHTAQARVASARVKSLPVQ